MRHRIPFALGAFILPGVVLAGNLNLSVELPRIDVAEYHRPYVAMWLEREDKSVAANLAVWYQIKKAAAASPNPQGGAKWLPDLRQWWRRSGRDLQMPVDGISGATRAPGEQVLNFSSDKGPLANLPAGQYKLIVETAREDGGREVIDIPFQWPVKQAQQFKAKGETELGAIVLDVQP
jgi:hypothetical protein